MFKVLTATLAVGATAFMPPARPALKSGKSLCWWEASVFAWSGAKDKGNSAAAVVTPGERSLPNTKVNLVVCVVCGVCRQTCVRAGDVKASLGRLFYVGERVKKSWCVSRGRTRRRALSGSPRKKKRACPFV